MGTVTAISEDVKWAIELKEELCNLDKARNAFFETVDEKFALRAKNAIRLEDGLDNLSFLEHVSGILEEWHKCRAQWGGAI